jgi:hypothetical protein
MIRKSISNNLNKINIILDYVLKYSYIQLSKFSKREEEHDIYFISIVDSGTSRGEGGALCCNPLRESGKGEIKILIKNF